MSDHFSGPRAIAGPACDICDVYAFPSAERPGQLVLVMTVHPMATPASSFSDAIVYSFRLRPVAIETDTPAFPFGTEDTELVYACTFDTPRPRADDATPDQDGYCVMPSGEKVRLRLNDERGGRGDGLRVYAGLLSDPFFIDLPPYLESIKTGRLAFTQPDDNTASGWNALSIVIEADCAPLLQTGRVPLFGVVGETVVAGKLPIRFRTVRPP
jgi:hypothetical protein